ncbi:MAG: hypothetical protein JXR76_32375 [Deltaproteobacteria bacterium]|nr:hypothetical protein [Deltaproteobacteria bacterium]
MPDWCRHRLFNVARRVTAQGQGHWVIGLTVLAMFLVPWPVCAKDAADSHQWYVTLTGFGSSGSDMEAMSNNAVGVGGMVRAGVRMQRMGLFLEGQRDYWLATDLDVEMTKGVLNLGMGADILLMDERLKLSLTAGTSTLMFDTYFDKRGTTGIYFAFEPTVFRWALTGHLIVEFSPFGVIVMIPAVAEPMLKRLAFRTSLGMEWQF